MIRLGIVDFDSSHSVEFAKRLNHRIAPEEQWVEGAEIVAGCVLPSAIAEQSRIDGFVRTFTEELGLPLVDRPEDLLGKIDGVLIEAVDGSVHLERARPFLEAGLPTFVDKPFACSVADAREMLTNAVIGLVILAIAFVVINFLSGAFAGVDAGIDLTPLIQAL